MTVYFEEKKHQLASQLSTLARQTYFTLLCFATNFLSVFPILA